MSVLAGVAMLNSGWRKLVKELVKSCTFMLVLTERFECSKMKVLKLNVGQEGRLRH